MWSVLRINKAFERNVLYIDAPYFGDGDVHVPGLGLLFKQQRPLWTMQSLLSLAVPALLAPCCSPGKDTKCCCLTRTFQWASLDDMTPEQEGMFIAVQG